MCIFVNTLVQKMLIVMCIWYKNYNLILILCKILLFYMCIALTPQCAFCEHPKSRPPVNSPEEKGQPIVKGAKIVPAGNILVGIQPNVTKHLQRRQQHVPPKYMASAQIYCIVYNIPRREKWIVFVKELEPFTALFWAVGNVLANN